MDLSADERERVRPYVTSVDSPVFALRNLPETVKGALFARYSRSPKSLRRLLLDEFLDVDGGVTVDRGPGEDRAAAFYDRVLADYGDDSVAQLGGAHVAVEGASNVLTKVLQWGRLASYLEQSTRYIAYTDRPGGHWRYHRPADVLADPLLGPQYVATLDRAFATYAALVPVLVEHWERTTPDDGGPAEARARAVRARALDSLRGLLPAATVSNMGVFASGQAFEHLVVRLRAHPLPEARECGDRILEALRQVIPAFVTRADRPDRGERAGAHQRDTRAALDHMAAALWPGTGEGPRQPEVRLVEHDPDGELRVAAHALWPGSGRPLRDVRDRVASMSPDELRDVLEALEGRRADRRERPGRALEATTYTFEVVCDYGAYRDLQRHRLLSLQAQPLGTALGWSMPDEVGAAGAGEEWRRVMEESAALYALLAAQRPAQAPYAVALAHRIRFTMTMNAREAMHLIELRSQPQGHPAYREVAQRMHGLIADAAGHRGIAAMMRFVDTSPTGLGRLDAERRSGDRT